MNGEFGKREFVDENGQQQRGSCNLGCGIVCSYAGGNACTCITAGSQKASDSNYYMKVVNDSTKASNFT